MQRFQDKGIIVTGGAKGIGRSISVAFAKEGASIAIWDLDEVASREAITEVEQVGGKAIAIIADVGIRADVEKALSLTIKQLPSVDVLVNNAAIIIHADFLTMTDEMWDKVIQTNLKSGFLCSQAVARYWIAEHILGNIINITSVDADVSHTNFPQYCVSKAGLRSLTKTAALALAPYGIRVNEVAPGFIVPGMASKINQSPWWPERVQSFVPLGRSGSAEEVALAVLFLSSNGASYITGACLIIDGGHSIAAHDWILRQFPS